MSGAADSVPDTMRTFIDLCTLSPADAATIYTQLFLSDLGPETPAQLRQFWSNVADYGDNAVTAVCAALDAHQSTNPIVMNRIKRGLRMVEYHSAQY